MKQILLHLIISIAGLYFAAKLFNGGDILYSFAIIIVTAVLNTFIFNFGNKK